MGEAVMNLVYVLILVACYSWFTVEVFGPRGDNEEV